jgi:phage tail-like protein
MADTLLRSFRFNVRLSRSAQAESGISGTRAATQGSVGGAALGDGGFQEVSGLEFDMDVQEYLEGGRNDGAIRRVGRAKYQPIVLKRGMFYSDSGRVNRDLWLWLQSITEGVRPVPRYDGIVEVMSVGDKAAAIWTFDRGLPAKIRGPALNAKTGDIAIEELHIAHEGLKLGSV